jgi:hypothetical protein
MHHAVTKAILTPSEIHCVFVFALNPFLSKYTPHDKHFAGGFAPILPSFLRICKIPRKTFEKILTTCF